MSASSRLIKFFSLFLFIVFLMACGMGPKNEANVNITETSVSSMPVPSTPVPIPTTTAPGIDEKTFYNLPQATLTESTGLFASPNRPEWIIQVEIPVGSIVYVMGKNATSSHLRVVWNKGVGWVPVSFTNYNADRDRTNSLPIFEREPPSCAEPIATQFNLNNEWTNDTDQKNRIAVVIDLFRSSYGAFPVSFLSLTVNGQEVQSSRRQIVEHGQFTLKDVVFTLPGYVYPGDRVGYFMDTTSNETLAFMATIFRVPEGCIWDTN